MYLSFKLVVCPYHHLRQLLAVLMLIVSWAQSWHNLPLWSVASNESGSVHSSLHNSLSYLSFLTLHSCWCTASSIISSFCNLIICFSPHTALAQEINLNWDTADSCLSAFHSSAPLYIGKVMGMPNPRGCLWVLTMGVGVGMKPTTHMHTLTHMGMGSTLYHGCILTDGGPPMHVILVYMIWMDKKPWEHPSSTCQYQ